MTTFLTIATPDKQATDTILSLPQLQFPRQTTSADTQTPTDSQTSSTSDTPSSSSGIQKSTNTAPPILITVSGQVYFWTSMPALDVVGTPVTTVMQGNPSRPIAIWNATQAHGYAVSNTVGQWAALGVLSGFGLLFLILFLGESIGFLRRRIHPSSSPSSPSSPPSPKDRKSRAIPTLAVPSDPSAIPLSTREPAALTTTKAAGGRQARRLSMYTPVPLTGLPLSEPGVYDASGVEGGDVGGQRYYHSNEAGTGGGEGRWS